MRDELPLNALRVLAGDRDAGDAGAWWQVPDLLADLASWVQAHHEVGRSDVANVGGTAEVWRRFEAIDLTGPRDQAPAFSFESEPGQQVAVLAAGCGQVSLECLRVRPGTGQALDRIQPPEAVFAWKNTSPNGEVNSGALALMLIHCHDGSDDRTPAQRASFAGG